MQRLYILLLVGPGSSRTVEGRLAWRPYPLLGGRQRQTDGAGHLLSGIRAVRVSAVQ